ncbi:13911_t:CDS:2 [Racocetra persica]|uniref:13911_t:CDS:1 n=1 Tax=Racocetra persica TaxID=160502 RepID=A0ACA9KMQ4_9GLOM|nr:13911_t:CDS:2 [Racocetra persica]
MKFFLENGLALNVGQEKDFLCVAEASAASNEIENLFIMWSTHLSPIIE